MKHPMNEHSRALVQKLWNYCKVLRHDGMSYGHYVEQLTYLLFLKMTYERTLPPRNEVSRIPAGYDWPSLEALDGVDLEDHYNDTLRVLAREPGLLGLIFRKSQNRFRDPAKLRRVIVDLIGPERWATVDADVKGDVYEGLLEKNAADTKSGAGQYFTPRAVIRAVVDVMQPRPDMTIGDPACGTGGFLLAAHDYITEHHGREMDRDQKRFLRDHTFRGVELVDETARLCAMNLFLHGIGGADINASPPIEVKDALLAPPSETLDMVLANPPFGRDAVVPMIGADGRSTNGDASISRQDFWASTSNKQLNFLQHIRSMLKIHGSAAVVLPDNVLFEGGAGEIIRRRLLHECNVHTLLRLPTGIFYAYGVKANVLFFERKPASTVPSTRELWVYDFRTNHRFTLKTRNLTRPDLQGFVDAFKPGALDTREEADSFKRWSYDEIADRPGFDLDIWAEVKDESLTDAATVDAPDVIAAEIIGEVQAGLALFAQVASELGTSYDVDAEPDDGVEALLHETAE
jgi:type I restriction enzyme M protein